MSVMIAQSENEWMNEWTNERSNERMNEATNEWMNASRYMSSPWLRFYPWLWWSITRAFSLTGHTLSTHPEPAQQKMARSPLSYCTALCEHLRVGKTYEMIGNELCSKNSPITAIKERLDWSKSGNSRFPATKIKPLAFDSSFGT